ncbi:MAG: cobyric acid synthase [Proteobacteria bacterium]|nr:cobyric acid synthase [Pseudomonadota bacterium]MBU1740757.1 cobyric acid synthase [Pseudomonadota bacterium]
MKYRPIMVVGTGSHVGKSVIAAALCRAYARRGLDVAPFKAQNMALNAGITPEGGEMGRAQITQAEAARQAPHVDMNPILIKPTGQAVSQVIVEGRVLGDFPAADYYKMKPRLTRRVMAAFRRLHDRHQLIVLEGAGSCAEVNLKKFDLVNLAMARRAGAKALLVGDIDAGGIFAQIVGTLGLMAPTERRLITGVIVNKFRGDPGLFQDGLAWLEKKTGKPVLGLLPYFDHIRLPQEDGVALERGELRASPGVSRVGVIRLENISNYTDVDALAVEDGVEVRWIDRPQELAGLDLLILPGTKNTLAALRGLKKSGLFQAIGSWHALGGRVLGLCGGYQILGAIVADPAGVEGPSGEAEGLGLLPVKTTMSGHKTTTRIKARAAPDLPSAAPGEVSGYEIHMGRTTATGPSRPAFHLVSSLGRAVEAPDGQVSLDGRVVGTYLHGVLDNDALRAALLAWVRGEAMIGPALDYAAFKDQQYDLLADLFEAEVDVDALLEPQRPSDS